jgi:hypothetical protein
LDEKEAGILALEVELEASRTKLERARQVGSYFLAG